MKKQDFEKNLTVILKEMCGRVGADFENMDFKKENWFHDYSWTEAEQSGFRDWLTHYLLNNKEARMELLSFHTKDKKRCRKAAEEWVWNYGWKTREAI